MTFIRPPPGGCFCISSSTLLGGQITPFELASLSLGFSPLPTVPPLPPRGAHGAFAALFGVAGAGWVGVVCAAATPVASSKRLAEIAANRCMCASGDMRGKGRPKGRSPRKTSSGPPVFRLRFRRGTPAGAHPVPAESGCALDSQVGACAYRRTGTHPGSSPGQAFAGTRATPRARRPESGYAVPPADEQPRALKPAPMTDLAAPLPALKRHKPFALFWVMRVATSGAYLMQSVAIGWQIYDLTGNPLDLGLVGLVQFFPLVLLAVVVGQIIDRFDRRAVARVCQVVKAICAIVLALGTWRGWLGRDQFFIILLVVGTPRAFETPTLHALVPSLVPPRLLPRAVAASATAQQTAVICGPALGGLIYAFGPTTVYTVCTVVFVAASVLGDLQSTR